MIGIPPKFVLMQNADTTLRKLGSKIKHAMRKAVRLIAPLRWMGLSLRNKRFYVELRYGLLPKLLPNRNPHLLRIPRSDLLEEARRFWFNNVTGTMCVNGHTFTRRDIYLYGGPDPYLTHPMSQRMEWLSRIKQTNLFQPHDSPQEEQCKILCERQGDDRWTHFHQNFNFSVGCNPDLAAPKCLCVFPRHHIGCTIGPYQRFQTPRCDQWNLVMKRRFARACQIDVVADPVCIDWSKYDLMFMGNSSTNLKFNRPDIPVILYGHDMWPEAAGYQWVIDWLQPDILLVPYPTPWREAFHLSARTRVVFCPFAPSMFFTRLNLDADRKILDLLVIGSTNAPIYMPRVVLDEQIAALIHSYRIEFSHHVGAFRNYTDEGTLQEGPDGPVRYLNHWSAYLGSARYVIFGRLTSHVHQFVLGKYYEMLGSGAIPIFPEVPDLKLLGISPFEHYIPLSEVEGRNKRLTYFLDHYEDYSYIARNAVEWSIANMDWMLFDDFEALIHEITGKRFPKRLID